MQQMQRPGEKLSNFSSVQQRGIFKLSLTLVDADFINQEPQQAKSC